jgi:hypothetical protein
MTRKDLQEKYNIIGNNDDISLYRKRGEYDHGMGYCGNISLKRGMVVFNGIQYSTIEALDNALREWEKSLPWPVDTYNPMMRRCAVLEDRVIWYLTEKMGFKTISSNWQVRYSKEIGINSSISFIVDRAGMKDEKITIVCPFGPYTLRQEIADVDEAVAMISSIVRQQVLQMASGIVEALSVCPDVEVPEMEAYVKSNRNLFGIERIDYKSMMVSLLEKELKKLKEE